MGVFTREIDKAANSATVRFELSVNGEKRTFELDPRTTLLDALREHLALGGSKKGCDQGQCGACTVHINGKLHAMQLAFVECDGFQCGYCTPGQIMSAVAMLEEAAEGVPSHVTPDVSKPPGAGELSLEEIRERMSGNICRCGAYPNIVEAIVQARAQMGEKR
jgi:xanthine dehydrogenase YagT iron-sulfur-binding subunit